MQTALRALSPLLSRQSSSSPSTAATLTRTVTTPSAMRKQVPIPTGPFPSAGLLPKDETQASSFLTRFPEYDGRGIRVAILDTGVDPASFGLNGANKVVDIIDCTGSGDVPLSTVQPLPASSSSDEGILRLPGASGRTLLLSKEWKNPKGTWRTGMKRAFEMWPGDLVRRRKAERKPEWDRKVAALLSRAKKDIADFEAASAAAKAKGEEAKAKGDVNSDKRDTEDPSASADSATGGADKSSKVGGQVGVSPSSSAAVALSSTTAKSDDSTDTSSSSNEDKARNKAKKQDLEARLTYLSELSIEDPGPILDIAVWHDGSDWRCVVGGAEGEGVDEDIAPLFSSSSSSGNSKDTALSSQNAVEAEKDRQGEEQKKTLDLRGKKPMTDFAKERHYERFGTQDLLSYSAKFYDDGEILSLCCVSGTHGSHVASIIGANVSEQPELNGVAPGVEIVSLTIGDNRLHALETHQALMRATKAILDTECDICNMSFGEDAAWSTENRGQFISMLRDEVIKKRNVIFVGAAGNSGPALSTVGAPMTTSGIVTVGAYETPSMQAAEYAMLETVPAGPYTWSSRGPTYDGGNVTIWAPGGAVAGTNAYALQHSQLMNGTSMASPNVCGAISLVLSALKAEGISWTPARVHHALRMTAKDVDDPQPVGLIQVEALYKYLVEHKDRFECDADFDIHVTPPGRQAPDFTKALGEREGLRGVYLREKDETNRLYEASCHVRPSFSSNKETEKLLQLDLKLALASSEPWVRAPKFVSLPSNGRAFDIRVDPTSLPPGAHFAEIRAFDTSAGGRVVFTIPVCVCKPEPVSTSPSITLKEIKTSPGFIERKFISVPEGANWAEMRITAKGNQTPAQLWIHCVQLQPEKRLSDVENQIILNATQGETVSKKFSVVGGVTMEVCISQFWKSLPNADITVELHFHGLTLDTGRNLTVVGGGEYPRLQVSSKVRFEQFSPSVSFDRRRAMLRPTESKISTLGSRDVMPDGKRLYQLLNTYSFSLSEKTKVKPCFSISGNLYDNPFAVLTQIKDSRGYIVQWGSVYPAEVELGKGEYKVLLQMEHTDYKVLQRNKGLAMGLEAQLGEKSKKRSLNVHRDHIDASSKGESNPFKNIKMQLGETRPLVLSTDLSGDTSDLYKSAKPGDVLLGQLKLGPSTAKSDFVLTYVLPPKPKEEDDSGDGGEDGKDAPLLVDLQLGLLEKIKDEKQRKKFLDTILAENPTHLPALVAALKALKAEDADPKDVTKAADAVLAEIDENALAVHLGKKALPSIEQSEEDKKTQKAMEEKKKAWATAYARKIEASYKSNEGLEEQNKLFDKYRLFVDAPEKDQEFSLISAKRDFAQQRYGSALNAIKKLLDESLDKDKYKDVTELEGKCFSALGWTALSEYKARWKLVKEPIGEVPW